MKRIDCSVVDPLGKRGKKKKKKKKRRRRQSIESVRTHTHAQKRNEIAFRSTAAPASPAHSLGDATYTHKK